MNNQNVMKNNNRNDKPVVYEVNGKEIRLTPNMVKSYLVNGNSKVTDEEVILFMKLCEHQKLDPFLNEAYLVKFGNNPAQNIVSKEAFMKRAENNKAFKGFEAGVIVMRESEIVEVEGAIKLPQDTLIGAYANVYREDRERPIKVKISFDEFGKNQSTWKTMPLNMIRKTAIVNALREAFPNTLGAMYTEDDADLKETNNVVFPQEEEVQSEVEQEQASVEIDFNNLPNKEFDPQEEYAEAVYKDMSTSENEVNENHTSRNEPAF